MKKVLEMDSGVDIVQQCEYIWSLNCTLKIVKMLNSMLCVFYHSFQNYAQWKKQDTKDLWLYDFIYMKCPE